MRFRIALIVGAIFAATASPATAQDNSALCAQEADRDAAIRACDALIRAGGLEFGLANALFNRGTNYAHQGDLARGFADLSEAIRVNPSFASAWQQRSGIRQMQGDWAGAAADAAEANRLDSRYGRNFAELRSRAAAQRTSAAAPGGSASFASGGASSSAPTAPASPAASGTDQTEQNCVSIEQRSGASMYLTNNCSHPVIGKFCYENDQFFNCGSGPGGFGPLAPGASELIHGPSAASWQARWKYCDHDAWNRGACTIAEP